MAEELETTTEPSRADEPHEPEHEPERPVLDPETAARRAAALAHVRKFGDPVLKSRALPVERFDDDAARRDRADGRRSWATRIGIGLAATQLGVMHRVLVYRVGEDAPLAALVNPEIEWASERRGDGGGGLPQPPRRPRRRRAPACTSGSARRTSTARTIEIEAVGAGGAGDPARDGPPRRRADPRPHHARAAQGGDARAARGRRGRARRRSGRAVRTVFLGTSDFAAAVLERLAARASTGPRWS